MRVLLVPILAALLAYAPRPHAAFDDPTIVAIFDDANSYDIATSDLALRVSRAASVRDLAQQFKNDHTAVRQQGRDLAKKLNVKPTPPKENPLSPDHEKALKELRGLSGAAFDRAYAAEEVRFHQQVIDAIKGTLLAAITNEELKAMVQKIAPAFEAHLLAAKRLDAELHSGHVGT
jgi:putative membrane protein